MEWVVGIYLAVGLYKAFETLASDVTDRPLWMYSQRNPLVWALCFVAYVFIWPVARK
jgi:hypothetical protein